jgi:hypothetical protein
MREFSVFPAKEDYGLLLILEQWVVITIPLNVV